MIISDKSTNRLGKIPRIDPETGLYIFTGHRKIRAQIYLTGRNKSTLRFRAVLQWFCWICGRHTGRHDRNIPIGCPQIDRWIVTATCPQLAGTEIVVTEAKNRMTPERPLVSIWDVLEYIASCRPEFFGYHREIDYGHRRKHRRTFGWDS
jgi:hypothetical protein